MNFLRKEVPVDLDRLREEIGEPPTQPVRQERYAPLQIIGHAITRLTWADAVKMGSAIKKAMEQTETGTELTAAIQTWAKDWESFE